MVEQKKSVMIRINNQTKNLLNEVMKNNSKNFRSYAELLEFLLKEKSSSKAHKLANDFLLTEMKCTDLASQVYLGGSRADVMGGRLIVGNKENTSFGHLIESELHLVEIKKSKEEIKQAIGQLLLYRQLIQKNSWVDLLYIYLAVEDKLPVGFKELLDKLGIGFLSVEGAKITLELEPKEQTTFLLSKIKNKSKFECEGCSSEYNVREMGCHRCGKLLRFNIYDDVFKKTNIRVTNELKRVLTTDPILKYIYNDVDKVIDNLYRKIGSGEKSERRGVYAGEKKVLL